MRQDSSLISDRGHDRRSGPRRASDLRRRRPDARRGSPRTSMGSILSSKRTPQSHQPRLSGPTDGASYMVVQIFCQPGSNGRIQGGRCVGPARYNCRVVSDSRPSPVERGVMSVDGSLPFDRLQIEAWRRMSPLDRLLAADALSREVQGARARRHPTSPSAGLGTRVLPAARRDQAQLRTHGSTVPGRSGSVRAVSMDFGPLQVVPSVGRALDQGGLPYYVVGGSWQAL